MSLRSMLATNLLPRARDHSMSLVTKLRSLALIAAAVIAALTLSAPAKTQEFSANIITTNPRGEAASKPSAVRVMNGRVRFETPDLPTGFFLVSNDPDAAYFVRPAARAFMDAGGSSRLPQLFVPLDPDDPCPRWQAMAKAVGSIDPSTQEGIEWRCTRIGDEKIDGRDTIRHQATLMQSQQRAAWIDPRLRFPLKIVAEDGTIYELKDIVEAPQTASQFEIPADFRKFDPLALIQRLKHSDVWVGPPEVEGPTHPLKQ